MSLELPPMQIANSVKEAEFLQRRPEMFYNPFLTGSFLNGIHHQKVIEHVSLYGIFFYCLSCFNRTVNILKLLRRYNNMNMKLSYIISHKSIKIKYFSL